MKIETRKIELSIYHIQSKGKDKVLASPHEYKTFPLTDMQIQMLEQIAAGKTLEQIAMESLTTDQEFSFVTLYKLLETLIEGHVIIDNVVKNYFHPSDHFTDRPAKNLQTAPSMEETLAGHVNTQHLATLPFFRKLPKALLSAFIGHAVVEKVPERTRIIAFGENKRDLYVIFKGEASVYIPGVKHRHLITTVPAGSVFGEGGFFFGHPRTADVISNMPTVLARIRYDEHAFEHLIHAPGTHELQRRLWIMHGLLSSPLFHHVPGETLDQFALAGKSRSLENGEELFKQGDPGNSFFVVIQGHVDILHNTRLVKSLKQGEMFGEIALMINRGERSATAKAMGETLLLEVQRGEFYKVLAQNLILAKQIEEVAVHRFNDLHG